MGGVATIIQRSIEHQPPRLWAVVLAILVLAGLGVAYRLSKTSGLNKDPLQHELANLIIQMMVCGAAKNAQNKSIIKSFLWGL